MRTRRITALVRAQQITVTLALGPAWLAAGGCDEVGPPGTVEQAIVGGRAAAAGELPAVVALVHDGAGRYQVLCSATLVADRLALTAAHCLVRVPETARLALFVGNDLASVIDPEVDERLIAVTARWPHPEFVEDPPSELARYFDLALVELGRPAVGVAPMLLVRPDEVAALVRPRAGVLIAGFGLGLADDGTSKGVKRIGVTTIGEVGEAELWIWGTPGPQKCAGDSGGPTFGDLDQGPGLELRLVGVASRAGQGCQDGSAETRVDAYRDYFDWVEEHAGQALPCGSGSRPACGEPWRAFGEPCDRHDECEGAVCALAPSGHYCTRRCGPAAPDSGCPGGYACDPDRGACLAAADLDAAAGAEDGSSAGDGGTDGGTSTGSSGGCALSGRPDDPAAAASLPWLLIAAANSRARRARRR